MDQEKWISWKMQTSRRWDDIEDILKYINIDFIDYDHKILVEFALKLNQVIDRAESEFSLDILNETEALLLNLYNYAVSHFSREEKFMESYNLPEIEMHKREHKHILDILKNHLEDFKKGRTNLDIKIKYQVMDWLIKHINIVDFNYFNLDNWSQNLNNASDWEQVREIIHVTGIREIDQQHQVLTEMAIKMMEEIRINNSYDNICLVFDRFKALIEEHFDFEEKFIKLHQIEKNYNHFDQHDFFKQKLNLFPQELHKNLNKVDDLKIWILTWWINHINSVDKNTFDYNNWAYNLIESAQSISEIENLLKRTGNEIVDNDHLSLMHVAMQFNNRINYFIEEKVDMQNTVIKKEISNWLKEIYSIAENHFYREEEIIKSKFPYALSSHRLEHQKILEHLKGLEQNFNEDRIYVSNNIKTMILDWWIQHTNEMDFRVFSSQNYDEV